MVTTTAQLRSTSLKLGSAHVQILLEVCRRFAMVRISDIGPDWNDGKSPSPVNYPSKIVPHLHQHHHKVCKCLKFFLRLTFILSKAMLCLEKLWLANEDCVKFTEKQDHGSHHGSNYSCTCT